MTMDKWFKIPWITKRDGTKMNISDRDETQVTADQCHRGYTLASDSSNGLMSLNPLYIRLALKFPSTLGHL